MAVIPPGLVDHWAFWLAYTVMNRTTLAASRSVVPQLEEYERNGFTIFRNVLPPELIAEVRQHIDWLTAKYPDVRPEHLHHPLMRDDAFWVRLVTDSRLLDIAELFLGPNIACFTSHYICKPAHTGHAVLPHQDGAYWRLEPMRAATLWLAVDESAPDNGCLNMITGSHRLSLQAIKLRKDKPNMLGSELDLSGLSDEADGLGEEVAVHLQPGDVSVHHPNIVHGSKENRSGRRRAGLDIGYMDASTRILNEGLYLDPILCRGRTTLTDHRYRAWPMVDPEKTIPFAGDERWNQTAAAMNTFPGVRHPSPADEPVAAMVARMITRIQAGTVKA